MDSVDNIQFAIKDGIENFTLKILFGF